MVIRQLLKKLPKDDLIDSIPYGTDEDEYKLHRMSRDDLIEAVLDSLTFDEKKEIVRRGKLLRNNDNIIPRPKGRGI